VFRCKQIQLFLCLVLSLALNGISSSSHAETIKVCYDQWPPMTIFPSEESSARGVVIDMVEKIYTSKGYQMEYYEVPLARGLSMVADGLCDMLPEYVFAEDPENEFVYAAEETFAYTTAFVVRRGDEWRYNGVKSIFGKRIATGPGWDYSSMSPDYQKYIDDPKNAKSIEVISGYDDVVDRIFRMIAEKRVDLYADNELVLQYVLNRLGLNDVLQVVSPGLENKLFEMPIFSKSIPSEKRQDLIRIWNQGRVLMKGEEEEALLKKYNVKFEN